MTRFLAASVVAVLAIAGAAACATKKYVQTTVHDAVHDATAPLTPLTGTVGETQERLKQDEALIKDLDATVQSVRQTAHQASQSAKEAATLAKAVETKTESIEMVDKGLVYEVVVNKKDVTFEFEHTDLSATAKNELTTLVEALERDPKNVQIAIEGHTDSSGSKAVNERIGLERAEAVERYLYETHHVPLTKMGVISYGEDKPVATNTTKAGRAQNRRVVVTVMAQSGSEF